MKKDTTLEQLYERLLAGQCTRPELQALLDHFERTGTRSPLMERILAELQSDEDVDAVMQQRVQRMIAETDEALAPVWQSVPTRSRRFTRFLPYAAAVALLCVVGWFVFDTLRPSPDPAVSATEILPGGNHAVLTLADGRMINLDETQSGIVVHEDAVSYEDGSALDFGTESLANIQKLTLTTPKGGTYQVTLPDGSRVWLNAGSSLTYPSRFTPKSREVTLTGEAYFEIQEQRFVPFKVLTEGQEVEVLGTQFNLSAYADDPATQTTLVEGSVRVHIPTNGASLQLQPGEQGQLVNDALGKSTVDIAQYISWKSGLFDFTDQSLDVVMRQLARWYDLEIVYEGEIPQMEFFGKIYRTQPLSNVLKILESAQINFRVEAGRKLIISATK